MTSRTRTAIALAAITTVLALVVLPIELFWLFVWAATVAGAMCLAAFYADRAMRSESDAIWAQAEVEHLDARLTTMKAAYDADSLVVADLVAERERLRNEVADLCRQINAATGKPPVSRATLLRSVPVQGGGEGA